MIGRLVIMFIVCADCCTLSKWDIFEPNRRHTAVVILARGGSKGIPLKNLAQVAGKSLLRRTLERVKDLELVDSVWVSTDHHAIATETEKVDSSVNIHWRSPESATDEASSIFAVQEFLGHHQEVDVVALVQCTSPFIRRIYLQQALSYIKKDRIECVFSVSSSHKLLWTRRKGQLLPLNFNPADRKRRQDSEVEEFAENGMFYIAKRNLLERGIFQTIKIINERLRKHI